MLVHCLSAVGWTQRALTSIGGVFGAATDTFALESTAEVALGSTADAVAFTAERIFGVGANRWLVTEDVIEEAFASAGEENPAPDALAAVGVEDPAPEDTLAASKKALALKKKLKKMKDEQEVQEEEVADDKMELIQKTAEPKDQPPLQL
eukprot:s273_g17.t1